MNNKKGYKISDFQTKTGKSIDVILINNGHNKQKESLYYLNFYNGDVVIQIKTAAGTIGETINEFKNSPLIEFLE